MSRSAPSTPEDPSTAGDLASQPPLSVPATAGPASGRWSAVDRLGRVGRRLGEAPLTVGLIATIWLLGLFTGSLSDGPPARLAGWVGASVPNLASGHLIMLVTSGFWAGRLTDYLLATLVLVAVGVVVERHRGALATAALGLGIQVLGVLIGLVSVALLDPLDESWSDSLRASVAVTPMTFAVGLLMADSARWSAFWRRRVRLLGFTLLSSFALFSGHLDDSLALAGAAVGLVAGVIVWRPTGPRVPVASTRRETRSLVALIVGISAAGPLLVSSSSTAVGPFRVLRYLFVSPRVGSGQLRSICADLAQQQLCAELLLQNRFRGFGPSVQAILPAIVVLVLAWGLYRGRRSAWWMAGVAQLLLLGFGLTLLLSTVLHRNGRFGRLALLDLRGAPGLVPPILVPLILLALLYATRRAFRVRAPRGTYRRLIVLLGVFLVAVLLAYLVIGELVAGGLTPRPDLLALIRTFPLRLVPPGYLSLASPRLIPHTWAATQLLEWTGVVVWLVALIGVLLSFRATWVAGRTGDAARVRDILRTTGGSALSYLTTWEGNTYWFNAAGTSYVAYRAHGGVALTTADPVGPMAERETAVAEFARFCDAHGWMPCLYSVTAQTRQVALRLGWQDVQVAEETVLQLGSLVFKGKKFQDIRTSMNRAARSGIQALWVSYPTAPTTLVEQVLALSEEWVADKALPEMGFTLGGVDELDDPEVRCLLAVDTSGRLHGITSWLPVYRDGSVRGWTLDFMRRPDDGFSGVMEFLIASAALAFQAEGAAFVSLSGAPLARASGEDDLGGLQRLLDVLGRTLEPVYGFRSLLAFKAKFQPEYQPLYMCFPDPTALPRIAAAIGHAYLPDLSLGQLVRTFGKL